MSKTFSLGIALILVLLVGVGGAVLYLRLTAPQPSPEIAQTTNVAAAVPSVPAPSASPSAQNFDQKLTERYTKDSDVDGLTNDEEKTLGTNPANPDSDADGLLDRDEAKKFKTNPLRADTDGDGMSDGQEVLRGRNPLVK